MKRYKNQMAIILTVILVVTGTATPTAPDITAAQEFDDVWIVYSISDIPKGDYNGTYR